MITNQNKEGIVFKYDKMKCIYEQEQSGFTNSNFELENIEADLIN
jgi:hypothetical protein